MRPLLPVLLLALSHCAGAAPYAPVLPGTELDDAHGRLVSTAALRVLAERDGRLAPVAGAVVTAWSEEIGPGAAGARELGAGRTDELGFANVSWNPDGLPPFHWTVEAEGYAAWHDVGMGGDVILAPAHTHRFRLLDPLGRPLAGARVEAFHGCPHAPELRGTVSDEDGLVVLPGLEAGADFELWIVAPGAAPGPYGLPTPAAGDAVPSLLTDPGRTATGVVVDAAGEPVPGLVVREIDYPRGPFTITDAAGRFVLHGVETGVVGVFRPDAVEEGERPQIAVADFTEDVPLRLVLDPDGPRDPGDGEVRHGFDVVVTDHDGTRRDVPVVLTRLADGFTLRAPTADAGRGLATFQAPPGEYRVRAGGGLSPLAAGENTVSVPREGPVRLVLESRPSLVIRGPLPEGFAELRVPGARTPVTHSHTFRPVPAAGPAVLVLGERASVILPVGPVEDGIRPVAVPPGVGARARTVVRVRVRSEDPDVPPDALDLEWDEGEWDLEPRLGDDGVWVAETTHAGRGVLEASADGHATERRVLDLPVRPGRIELPEIVLGRTVSRTFRIVDADGRPVTEAEPELAPRNGWGNELVDEHGRFTVEVGPAPEAWVIASPRNVTPPPTENWHPLRVNLSRSSPEEIRFPGGRITVEVRDEEGRPLAAVGYVDLERIEADDGTLDLRGVPAGPHVLVVGARDRIGEVLRIELGAGEHRRIELKLRERP